MLKKLIVLSILIFSLMTSAFADTSNYKQQFWYVGLIGGYGDVDWSDVVAQDIYSEPSNPTSANGNGLLYGLDLGYQFNSFFAIEGELIELPTSTMTYAQYPINIPGAGPVPNAYLAPANVDTNLTFTAITLKVMVPFFYPNLSIFADAGPAYQYRSDVVQNVGTWAPTFGGGFMYRFAEHWQGEASFQYAPGTGKSVYNPMIDYVPELYMGTLKIDYIF